MAYSKKAKPTKGKKKGSKNIMKALGGIPNNGMTIKSYQKDSNYYN